MNNKLCSFISYAFILAIFFTILTSIALAFAHIKPFILWLIILEVVFFSWVAIIAVGLYVLAHLGLEAREKIHIWAHEDCIEKVDFAFHNIPALAVLGLCLAIIQSVAIIGCWIGISIALFIAGILYLKKKVFEKRVCRSVTSKVLKEI